MRLILGLARRVRSVLRQLWWSYGASLPGGHPARHYWNTRHRRYGFDLRGVGHCGLSHEENQEAYNQAREVLLATCKNAGVDWTAARTLEIGCGTGFYAGVARDRGARTYLGIDISDVLLDELRERFSGYRFEQKNVARERIQGEFDLILMIDVTQHLIAERDFAFAIRNVKRCLADGGVFIVTSWLSAQTTRRTYYEIVRPMSCYSEKFPAPEFTMSKPVPFRDKFIFAVIRSRQGREVKARGEQDRDA